MLVALFPVSVCFWLLWDFFLHFQVELKMIPMIGRKTVPVGFQWCHSRSFFDGNPELPLISRHYPVHSLIQTLLASDGDECCVCKVQHLGAMQNAWLIWTKSTSMTWRLMIWVPGEQQTHFHFMQSQDSCSLLFRQTTQVNGWCLFSSDSKILLSPHMWSPSRIIADVKGDWLVLSKGGVGCISVFSSKECDG